MIRLLWRFGFRAASLALLLAPASATGAACCGGGFAAPSLIAGDDRATLSAVFSHAEIRKDVYADGTWANRRFRESTQTLRLEGAHTFSDLWQAGFAIPVVQRGRSGDSTAGLGDISGTLGYEILPDWDYHPWRPRGHLYLQLSAPTGRAVQASESLYQLDGRGRGFWAAGLGALFTKGYGAWDLFMNASVRRGFRRSLGDRGTLIPGWGGELALGFGHSFGDFRVGPSLTWSYEDAVAIEGSSSGARERFATLALAAAYLIDPAWAATISVFDQTLFGHPVNARLGRGATLQLQRRWAR